MNSSRRTSNQTLKKSTQTSIKLTVEDQLLRKYPDVIIRHPKEELKFLCIICQEQGSPFYSGLWNNCKDHLGSQSHKKASDKAKLKENALEKQANQNIEAVDEMETNTMPESSLTLTPSTRSELNLTYSKFILQYRLPFSIVGALHSFNQQLIAQYPPSVLQDYSISRKTVTKATESICDTLKGEIFQELRSSPFSLSLDLSTDSFGRTYMGVCARYLEEENYELPQVKLISILPISTSSTGETIAQLILDKILIDEELRLNFMGLATDDGGNMTGCDIGAGKKLKDVCGHLVNMKDISHALNNVLKKGLKAFPKDIQEIISDICSHFNRSTQRRALLREIIIESQMKPLEILELKTHRWLSMRNCLERILELWTPLEAYFLKYGNNTQKAYFSLDKELYLRVLNLLISNIADCNEFFQRDDLFYNEILEKIKHTFISIANIILKSESKTLDFTKIFEIPFDEDGDKEIIAGEIESQVKAHIIMREEFESSYLKRYDSITNLIDKVQINKRQEIFIASTKFIHLCLKGMKKKLPYNNEVMLLCQSLFFEEAYSEEKWLKLKDMFPNILRTRKQRDDFASEVSRMGYTYNRIKERLRNTITKVSPLTIWKSESLSYPNMFLLARALFVLPYTSIPVERVFSTLKDIVNIKRNKLTIDNVEACLLGYQAFKTETFIITDEIIENYTAVKKVVKKSKSKETEELASQNPLEKEEKENENVIEIVDVKEEDQISGKDENMDDYEDYEMIVRFEKTRSNNLKRSVTITSQEGLKKVKLSE